MAAKLLAGLRVVSFEARRADELATMLARHGAEVVRAPALREERLAASPEALELARRLEAGAVGPRGAADVAVFTNAAQVEHLFRAAADPEALRRGVARAVVASVGPVCSEALEAHGIAPDLEASPPKMGPLVALVAARARDLVAAKRGASTAVR